MLRSQALKNLHLISISIILILIGQRYWYVYHEYLIKYTDIDQIIMWSGASEFSKLNFWEPRFYSQKYNTLIEGLLASPFIRLGYTPDMVLPIISILMNVSPIIIITILYIRRYEYEGLLVVLIYYAMLPTEYYMITGVARGFVTGLIFSGIMLGVFDFITNRNIKVGMLINVFLIGVWVNPNSIICNLPILVFLLTQLKINYKDLKAIIVGCIPVFIIVVLTYLYYENNPEISIYRNSDWEYDIKNLMQGLTALDIHLNNLVPFGGAYGLLIIVLVIAISSIFISHSYDILVSFMIGIVVLIGSLMMNKIYDCNISVIYPCARMFLGLPVLIVFFLSKITPKMLNINILYLLILLTIYNSYNKLNAVNEVVNNELKKNPEMLYFVNINDLKVNCSLLSRISEKYSIDLFISERILTPEFYACSCLNKKFPPAIVSYWDRRYWLHYQAATTKFKKIGYVSGTENEMFDKVKFTTIPNDSTIIYRGKFKINIFDYHRPISSLTFFKINNIEHRPIYIPLKSDL